MTTDPFVALVEGCHEATYGPTDPNTSISEDDYPKEVGGGVVHKGYLPDPAPCRDCGAPSVVMRWLGPGGGTWVSHWCGPCQGLEAKQAGYRQKGVYTGWDAFHQQKEGVQAQRLKNSHLPDPHPGATPHPGFLGFCPPGEGPDDLWCGLIYGRRGTGKRTQAAAVGHHYLKRGWRVLFTTEMEVLDARLPDATSPLTLDYYAAPDLLILVDLGKEARTLPRQEAIRHVLDARYTLRRPTLITTHSLPSDIPRRWPEWEGVFLRIVEGCGGVEVMRRGRGRSILLTHCWALGEDVGAPDLWIPPKRDGGGW